MGRVFFLFMLGLQMALVFPVGALAQTVTDVTAEQRPDDSGLVDIRYTLSGAAEPMTVSLRVSPDGGATWQAISSVTGDVGAGIANGTRTVIWNAGADVPDIHWSSAQIEVTATPAGPGQDADLTITLPGGVMLEFVRIPAGTFAMGSPSDEQSRENDEGPAHTVNIAYDFYLGKYELTKRQWQAVMESTPWNGRANVLDDPDSPVVYINWHDAQNFISALNTHITNTGQGPAAMRLPSEAEWEYACRAGTTTRFYWGDDPSYTQISYYAWHTGNAWNIGESYAHVVGQKLPNAWGLYDMSGNVWEWCQDDWHDTYIGAPTDGSSWEKYAESRRVVRGGFFNSSGNCRSASRLADYSTTANSTAGFRLATVSLIEP